MLRLPVGCELGLCDGERVGVLVGCIVGNFVGAVDGTASANETKERYLVYLNVFMILAAKTPIYPVS